MRQENVNIIPLQAAATITSSSLDSRNLISMSLQLVATGAAAGTLKVQASNDNPQTPGNPVNFTDISGASVAVSGAGSYLIPQTDLCYEFIRAVYTNTGAGTLTVNLKALGE